MSVLIDKFVLLTGCFLFQLYYYPSIGIPHVLALLCALTFLCLCTCCNPDMLPITALKSPVLPVQAGLFFMFLVAGLVFTILRPFLPLLFYELSVKKFWAPLAAVWFAFLISPSGNTVYFILYALLFLLAFYLKSKTQYLLQLEEKFKQLRDTSTEYNLLLHQKNQELIKQQDYEIRVATLKERNRIAREIHDNVGHMLSRSILQAGALIAINKEPQLEEPLASLKDSLSLAMDSIRASVHDLHDDAIDLKASLYTLVQDFTDYDVRIDYDMSRAVPKNIKYCFIAIVKEGLSNISRHSNATRIRITVREHPVFYQLIIEDNGTDISTGSAGIGLINMQERVEQLHGQFSVTTQQGFRIFISVPKENS